VKWIKITAWDDGQRNKEAFQGQPRLEVAVTANAFILPTNDRGRYIFLLMVNCTKELWESLTQSAVIKVQSSPGFW
jgi:hypothetical protein